MEKSNSAKKVESEIKIANQFLLLPNTCLGKGSFGQIFKGVNLKNREEVALKIESCNIEVPQIMHENQILKSLQSGDGFPQVYVVTKYEDTIIMAMELLGENLENLMLQQDNKHFSLKTVLMIAIQLIIRIQFMHEQNLIHRDIKPENFVVGLKKKETTIYLIDYGLARRYFDKKSNSHIPYKEGKNITGTVRFASIYTHIGIEQSRRDDLESLGYMFVYFLKGDLPWQSISGKTKKEKYQKIKEKKIECCPAGLCEGLDEEFHLYFKYVRELQFDETPNYAYLIGLFTTLMKNNNMVNDLAFDWCRTVKNKGMAVSAESIFSQLKISYNHEKNMKEDQENVVNDNHKEKIKLEALEQKEKECNKLVEDNAQRPPNEVSDKEVVRNEETKEELNQNKPNSSQVISHSEL